MRRASILAVCVLAGMAVLGSGCSDDGGPKVLLAVARGGLGDQSFNDSAYAGLQRAADELDAEVATLDFDAEDQAANLQQAADEGDYDLIIALGAENAAPLTEAAAADEDGRYAIIDTTAEGENVASVVFRELEGDYLAGALTALLADGESVAFLGGAEIEVVQRVEHGWREGVLLIDPEAEIGSHYLSGEGDFSGFTKPEEARAHVMEQYGGGVAVMYVAAGGSALGAIEGADEGGGVIITTGVDQRYLAPEAVAASRIKDMGLAVFRLIEALDEGNFEAGVQELDLASGGIALTPLDSPLIPPGVAETVEELRAALLSGDQTVPPFEP